jgi:hypothetical protein
MPRRGLRAFSRCETAAPLPILAERLDIAVAFDDADDLEHILDVAKQDHVTLKRKATNVGTQLGARATECAGQRSELAALNPQCGDKSPTDDEIAFRG